jgi:hypothetical protein
LRDLGEAKLLSARLYGDIFLLVLTHGDAAAGRASCRLGRSSCRSVVVPDHPVRAHYARLLQLEDLVQSRLPGRLRWKSASDPASFQLSPPLLSD